MKPFVFELNGRPTLLHHKGATRDEIVEAIEEWKLENPEPIKAKR